MIGFLMMLATATAPPSDNFMTGNMLHDGICSPKLAELAMCESYIIGVFDGARLEEKMNNLPVRICLPATVTPGQLADMLRKDLRDHPERRSLLGGTLVLGTLVKAFPCSNKN